MSVRVVFASLCVTAFVAPAALAADGYSAEFKLDARFQSSEPGDAMIRHLVDTALQTTSEFLPKPRYQRMEEFSFDEGKSVRDENESGRDFAKGE